MPGAPSGRACEGCRQQKKKCGYELPACKRCVRLGVACVGSGQRRFLFIDQKHARRRAAPKQRSPNELLVAQKLELVPGLISPSDALISAFLQTIIPSTSCKYNLAAVYGTFLADLPKHLGINEALDAATQALVSAHQDFCLHRPVTVFSLERYSTAVVKLRVCLDRPGTAQSTETVCAVALLLMYQNLSGLNIQHWKSHCHGAAQILRARIMCKTRNEFEKKLLLALRVPMLIQGLYDRDQRLGSTKWAEIVDISSTFEVGIREIDDLIEYLSAIPTILQRGRAAQSAMELQQLRLEVQAKYEKLSCVRGTLHEWKEAHPQCNPAVAGGYGLSLALSCMYCCILKGLRVNREYVLRQGEELVELTLGLMQDVKHCRPLGASHMLLNLQAAWLCTEDFATKKLVEEALNDHCRDFVRGAELKSLVPMLEDLSRDLRFEGREGRDIC